MAEPLREFTRFNTERPQAATEPLTFRPSQLTRAAGPSESTALVSTTIASLLLVSPKADTHFTVPRRVKSRVDLRDYYIPRCSTSPQKSPIQLLTGPDVRIYTPCLRKKTVPIYLLLFVCKPISIQNWKVVPE